MPSKSSPRSARARSLAAIGVAFVSWLAGPSASAEVASTATPRTLVVGAPRGFSPSERVDADRSGLSRSRLPSELEERWRRHLGGGIDLPPVVDEAGCVIVAETIPEIIKLSPDGAELFRVRLQGSPTAPLVLTSRATIVVLTSQGLAIGLAPDGSTRFSTPLGVRGRDLDTTPLARVDGGVSIAAGRELIELDGDGVIRARTTLPERAVGALLTGSEGTLVTVETGEVYAFRPPGAPRRLGSFGGMPRGGAVRGDARTLLSVIDGKRIVALDLPTGTTHVRASAGPGDYFDAPIAVASRVTSRVASAAAPFAVATTFAGRLVVIDVAGDEKAQFGLEKQVISTGLASAAGLLSGADPKPSPPVVIDAEGRVAFARASGRVGVLGVDGGVVIESERLCGSPASVQPAGEGRLVVACRDGALWMFGDKQSGGDEP